MEERLGRAWGGQRSVPVCLLQMVGLMILETLSSLNNCMICGRPVLCPKHKTFGGAWWPHAELVRGECYLLTSHAGKVLFGARCDPCILM